MDLLFFQNLYKHKKVFKLIKNFYFKKLSKLSLVLCLDINSNLFNLAFFDFAVIRLEKSLVD